MRPTSPGRDGQALWELVKARVPATLPPVDPDDLLADPLREALLEPVVRRLATRLSEAPGLGVLAREIEADEEAGVWEGAKLQARRLGFDDDASVTAVSLLSVKTTSDEGMDSYFHALQAAAAEVSGATAPATSRRGQALFATHRDALSRFLVGQHAMTVELLDGLAEVPLHRGDSINGVLRGSTANPGLWPLASFCTGYEVAVSFAYRARERDGGTAVVYSAVVPTCRIIATPATGMAAVSECEVVIGTPDGGDLATVTPV